MTDRLESSRIKRFLTGSVGRAQVLLVLVTLLPLLLVQTGIYWAWFSSRMEAELQSNLEMASAVASSFQNYVRDIRRQEWALGSALAGLRPYSPENANRLLRHAGGGGEYFAVRSWSYASPDGRVVSSSVSDQIGRSLGGQDYFGALLQGQEWILTNLFMDDVSGAPTVVIAHRIPNSGGGLDGIVVAAVDPSRLGSRALSVRRAAGGSFTVFDRAGQMIFSSFPDEPKHLNWLDDDPMLAPALAGKTQSGIFVYPTDRARHLTAHIPVPSLNLPGGQSSCYVVSASRPESTAMAEVFANLRLVAATNLAVIAASLLGGVILSRRITSPLGRLREHAQAIARGDLHWRTEIRAVSELGELADAMNRMASDLQAVRAREEQARAGLEQANAQLRLEIQERGRAEEALRQVRDALDQRVRERTTALSRTVEALQEEIARRTLADEQLRTVNASLEARSAQLQTLASELTLAEQRERHRLAQILHDDLQQFLVAAKLQAIILQRSGYEATPQAASGVIKLIDQSIEISRSLTAKLSPPILYEGGLIPALKWLARWMSDQYQLEVALIVDENISIPAREDVTVLLFRAVRELLFNVVKHSGVKRARVGISLLDSQLRIIVEDEGVGFNPSRLRKAGSAGGGFGLLSVRERLDILGGRMEMESAPGRGCRFTLLAPVGAVAAPEAALSGGRE